MLKAKLLSNMSQEELLVVYSQACDFLIAKLRELQDTHDPENEDDRYNNVEQAWSDVKRCHHELVLRRGREWGSRPLEEIIKDLKAERKATKEAPNA